jgi:3-hydroxyacyl-CoA dehydrogenase/enoyl-CoA hydratase/3-hydroxybutyryl-CoA epimerase
MPYTQIEKDNGVAIIWLDQPGERINKISADLIDEFDTVLDKLGKDDEVKGIVLISRKQDFIAGADLDKFLEMTKPGQAYKLSQKGHKVLNRAAEFPKPIVAALNGSALGGGLELALACTYRIATDNPRTVLALPEVRLGILPGGGGTQRLPRLIGLQRALNLMLTGKNVYSHQAKKIGLVDKVVNTYQLLEAAKDYALRLTHRRIQRKKQLSVFEKILESNPIGRELIYKRSRQIIQKRTKGNYPAAFKIIDCVATGMEKGMKKGFQAESKKFDELMLTPQCKQLINLFFGMNSLKKNPNKNLAHPVKRIGILGAGLMGAGIASVSINRGIYTIIKDMDWEILRRCKKALWSELDQKAKKGIITPFQVEQTFSRLAITTDYERFRNADIVIEAVFEDLDLMRKILAETEIETRDGCIYASNTSAIPISEIAIVAQKPEQVIGMHYFSPVQKMPLLEIVVTKRTTKWVVATAVELGLAQGKNVIVVKDGPGFYTTRILAPMLNETLVMLEEGGDILEIDQVMQHFGFPVGPFTLMDEVGIDVGAHVTQVLRELFAERGIIPSDITEKLFQAGFKGKKNQKGFYQYSPTKSESKKKRINKDIFKELGKIKQKKFDQEDIQTRIVMAMVNEAAYCLEEGILNEPRDGDLGAVLGLGFPPFLGGPFRYIDSMGVKNILKMLDGLFRNHGPQFMPAQIIKDFATKNMKFYTDS